MANGELSLTLADQDEIHRSLDYLKEFLEMLFNGGSMPLKSINSLVYEAEVKLSEIRETLSRREAFNLKIEKLEQGGFNIRKDGE